MTAAARICQADMERAAKAVKAAGYERARIIMDLANRKIEVIIGMAVVLWMVASVGPFLLGYGDVVPGKEIAVVLASCWTGWNWRALMKDTPNDPS